MRPRRNAGAASPYPNLAEIYREKVARVRQAIEVSKDRTESMEVARNLIAEIRLIPDANGLQIELRSELGGILALCEAQSNKARRD